MEPWENWQQEESTHFGPEAPKEIGEHARVVVGNDPPHIKCLLCGLRAAHANGHPRWAYLINRGCRNPPAGGEAPAAPFEIGEVEPPQAGVG